MRRSSLVLLASTLLPAFASAQASNGYPVKPVPLPDSAEIALAESAAPPNVATASTVYAVRDGQVRTIRQGTNGLVCMVARDYHAGSLYPICFNAEGARTIAKRELMQMKLRSLGIPEDSIDRAVNAAYARGELETPTELALAYMMSPKQVLFSSATREGRRVGAWHPHLMFYFPGVTPAKLGLGRAAANDVIQVSSAGTPRAEVVVKVPSWSDGTPTVPR
ncbi:MAG TPA: hypothetical protein VFZ21_25510 [Gemmatimonadaceae bacterium]|jgi:hypothetical protein|nr:hypothetical protein [Gemmatimonadaceae bacterium]